MELYKNGPPSERISSFSLSYAKNVKKLVLSLFCVDSSIHNMDALTLIPVFMRDLLNIIDRGVVFEMVCIKFLIILKKNKKKSFFLLNYLRKLRTNNQKLNFSIFD